jgi:hypothetical protein
MRAGDSGNNTSGVLDGASVGAGCGARCRSFAEGALANELASGDEERCGFGVEAEAFFWGEEDFGFEAL